MCSSDLIFTDGPLQFSAFAKPDADAMARLSGGRMIKEIDYARVQERHYLTLRLQAAAGEKSRSPMADAETLTVKTEPFGAESFVARIKKAMPDAPIAETTVLTTFDDYYYPRRGNTAPLPALRVKFADPMQSWLYIDMTSGQPVNMVHRLGRVQRWLYHGLHSLDFRFWYDSRAWDVTLILLLLGGLASSAIGTFLGFARLYRGAVRNTLRFRGRKTQAAE